MENNVNPSPEELQRLIEEAQKKVQAMVDGMTPEERARAEAGAKRLAEEERAAMQELTDAVARVAGAAPTEKEPLQLCPYCGAQLSGETVCEYCGSSLL